VRTLHFGLLGPVCAWRDGNEIDLGPGKQRAVLAVLLLQANRPVPTNTIVDAVWGDEPPGNGPNVVQKHVSGLRRALEPERQPRLPGRLLTLTDAGYTVRVEGGGLDVDVFRAQVDQAYSARAAGALPHAAGALRSALAQWRGPALAGLPGGYFDGERDRLTEIRMGALEECLDVEVRLGRHVQLARERHRRRQGARQITHREPALARDLRIGRPDLPRQYDDGGLVDVNHVPEHVLTAVLGLTPEQARRIVTERQRTGGFSSIEEIATRGLLPATAVRSLAEILIVIR